MMSAVSVTPTRSELQQLVQLGVDDQYKFTRLRPSILELLNDSDLIYIVETFACLKGEGGEVTYYKAFNKTPIPPTSLVWLPPNLMGFTQSRIHLCVQDMSFPDEGLLAIYCTVEFVGG